MQIKIPNGYFIIHKDSPLKSLFTHNINTNHLFNQKAAHINSQQIIYKDICICDVEANILMQKAKHRLSHISHNKLVSKNHISNSNLIGDF